MAVDYKSAGVDIDGGDAWVGVIKQLMAKRGGKLPRCGSIGGFSGLCGIGGGKSVAACCDGVGTKLLLAEASGLYRGLGQDLVAMSVNDLVTCGASPLFFLDYIACDRLNVSIMKEIMDGVLDGCSLSDCALLGGETAELPGIYPEGGFDLAGFAVGIADNDKIIDGSGITPGDVIIGLKSSGIHSNGYSLVRRVLVEDGLKLPLSSRPEELRGETLGESLMLPTRIYVRQAAAAIAAAPVKGMAHITGGGLESNIGRVIPDGLSPCIEFGLWDRPGIFELIAAAGVEETEMRRVFNLGIGFAFIVPEKSADAIKSALGEAGESPVEIGKVIEA
jgi:phosphoribosylformylglycinamidine cyclo-ligase